MRAGGRTIPRRCRTGCCSRWTWALAARRLMIQPPLRQAVAAGARVEIEKPVCRMRMTTEAEGLFDQSLDVLPTVTLNFHEAI